MIRHALIALQMVGFAAPAFAPGKALAGMLPGVSRTR